MRICTQQGGGYSEGRRTARREIQHGMDSERTAIPLRQVEREQYHSADRAGHKERKERETACTAGIKPIDYGREEYKRAA